MSFNNLNIYIFLYKANIVSPPEFEMHLKRQMRMPTQRETTKNWDKLSCVSVKLLLMKIVHEIECIYTGDISLQKVIAQFLQFLSSLLVTFRSIGLFPYL